MVLADSIYGLKFIVIVRIESDLILLSYLDHKFGHPMSQFVPDLFCFAQCHLQSYFWMLEPAKNRQKFWN